MTPLADQPERDRFVVEQKKNISVIAPAGVGKTQAIIDRIVHLALQPDATDRLPRLIVVTYSVRAAQEMQSRARTAIRAAGVSLHVHRAFQQTFFGTIHSYCVRLLDRFGHYLGLPSPVALLEDDDELWNRFLLHGMKRKIFSDTNLRDLFYFYPPEKLYLLGKEITPGREMLTTPMPVLSLRRLLDYRDNSLHPGTRKSIEKAQAAARQWGEAWARGERFQALPVCPVSEKAAAFAEIWTETFTPLHDWLREAALIFGRRVANAYASFRLSEAVMTYDDQVRLALRVLERPAVQRELKEERLSVLLDEAQDTDPQQFEVLLRVAGLRDDSQEDQNFCIVGDFQQAIYAPRSDLAMYRQMHEETSAEPRGTKSELHVTFRCDRAIIDFVNRAFPTILDGARGQCKFVDLVPRPGAGPGQVVRWICPGEPEPPAGKKIDAEMRARHEAQFVARQIKDFGLEKLGASDWSQVAILCPRKLWLQEIGRELRLLELPVQLHSSNERQGDLTPCVWLTSLVWIIAHPEDSFEIAGVLREIFGVSDHDMATYTQGNGEKLRIDHAASPGDGEVESVLKLLRDMYLAANTSPVHRFVQQLVEKTQLRERLRLIAEWEVEDTDRELDDFLALILERCADEVTLPELAEELRHHLAQASPGEEEVLDAIQLLTSHKAKGLEWQVVIVPFVFRAIESKSLPYPRLIQMGKGKEVVCRDKFDFASQAGDFVAERERQQLQRLLYVMSTRAKRKLLFVDDEDLFSEARRRSGWSAAELLGLFSGMNRETWQALPQELAMPESSPSVEFPGRPEHRHLPSITSNDFSKALAHASAIPHRVTPHALAAHPVREEAEPEKLAELEEAQTVRADNPGIRYGTWWHEFIQELPWQKPRETWEKSFAKALLHSPQPERSREEWELFTRSSLAQWLAEPGRIIQSELPFMWIDADKRCIEGVMDLAVYTPEDSSWRVIDWKTNRIGTGGSAEIVAIYREQIRAYVKVLREMLAAEVRGSLYLTAWGECLDID